VRKSAAFAVGGQPGRPLGERAGPCLLGRFEQTCYDVRSLQFVAMLRVVDFLLERTVRLQFPVREALEVDVTTGTIKKVVSDRGFGFIAAEDAKEYFFHRGGLDSSLDFDRLTGGERVEFEIEQSPKGPRAVKVHGV
jgi:CspA family cold shock protein